jgi:hypothetical protein
MCKFVLSMSLLVILAGGTSAFAQTAAEVEAPESAPHGMSPEAEKEATKSLTEGKKPGSIKEINEAAKKQQERDAKLKKEAQAQVDPVLRHIIENYAEVANKPATPEAIEAIKKITTANKLAGGKVLNVANETDMYMVATLAQFPETSTAVANEIQDSAAMVQSHPEIAVKYLKSLIYAASAEKGSANSVIKRGMTKIYFKSYGPKALETFAEGWHAYGLKLKAHELVGDETFIKAVAEAFSISIESARSLVKSGCFFKINAAA